MQHLYYGGDILPMTGRGSRAEALVEEDGRIAYVGPLDEAHTVYPHASKIDLAGACLMPGLIDPHSHFTGTNQYMLAAQLDQCESFDELVATLRQFAGEQCVDSDGVILGVSYDHNNLAEGRHPTREVLDRVSRSIPVVAMHASSHMCVANSRALELAGLNASTPDPTGGRYGRTAGGDLTGYCEEPAAMWPLLDMIQQRQHVDMDSLIESMQVVYLQHGITTCQDGATTADQLNMLVGFAERGMLKLDITCFPMAGEDIDGMLEAHRKLDGPSYRRHLRIAGLKMFLDGSPQGRTAWMSEPYTPGSEGEDFCGHGTMTDDAAYAFARQAIDSGHQLLTHVNGDAALDQLLRVYRRALADSPNPSKDRLHPVAIHCQTARRDQYDSMAELGMIPSIFTNHIWYWGDVHLRNFGPKRGGRISAVRDALDAGLAPTFHTDCPVLRPNLFESVWCAVRRVTQAGAQLDLDQRIDVYQGLECITVNGARQYGELDRKGTLEAGKLADFCIVERNPLDVPLDDLRDLQVLTTIKEGCVAWRA